MNHMVIENSTVAFINLTTSSAVVVESSGGMLFVFPDVPAEIAEIVNMISFGFLLEIVCVFGIVTNTIIIVVLSKQGFGKTTNINLLGLAVSDLMAVFSKACDCTLTNPWLNSLDLSFIPGEVTALTFGVTHVMFTRISGWVTAFITLERCLCVAAPLTIKRILTPQRNLSIIICIYAVIIAGVCPFFYIMRYEWRFDAGRNHTVLGVTYTEARQSLEGALYIVNFLISPLVTFGVIIICTAILAHILRRKSQWRQRATQDKPANSSSSVSQKDAKVIKLVTAVSVIFIITAFPTMVGFVWLILDPETNVVGQHKNLYLVLVVVTYLFEAANSSVNLFVYLRMSTSFRETFDALFRRGSREPESNKGSVTSEKE